MLPIAKIIIYGPIFFICIINITISVYLVPKELSRTEELFVLKDVEYILKDQRATWDEAKVICSQDPTSSLAIIKNDDQAKFLAVALSESNFILEDLWIGAKKESQKNNEDVFQWLTGDIVDLSMVIDRSKDEIPTKRGCLSIVRDYHEEPRFVDLFCKLKRPFICQRPHDLMTHDNWIQVDDYEYAIFNSHKTWGESVLACWENHRAELASFRNMKEVNNVTLQLRLGHPSLNAAWIGGHRDGYVWSFIGQSGIISLLLNETSKFPPWKDENFDRNKPCLRLVTNMETGQFSQQSCSEKQSYVCARNNKRGDFDLVILNNTLYTVHFKPKDWFDAKETCENNKSRLVEVYPKNINDILYIMGENRTEINHIWIGGKLNANNNTWSWVTSLTPIASDPTKLFQGYPPWLDKTFDPDYGCLNMDRENHNVPIFYGVFCDERQQFICEQPNPDIEITTFNPWKWVWPTSTTEVVVIKPGLDFNQKT